MRILLLCFYCCLLLAILLQLYGIYVPFSVLQTLGQVILVPVYTICKGSYIDSIGPLIWQKLIISIIHTYN